MQRPESREFKAFFGAFCEFSLTDQSQSDNISSVVRRSRFPMQSIGTHANGNGCAPNFLRLLRNTSSWNFVSRAVSGSNSGGEECLNPTIGVFRRVGCKRLMCSNPIGVLHLKRALSEVRNSTNLTLIHTRYWIRLLSDKEIVV